MAGKADIAKGRVKEAAGAITDDDKLRREGKVDQAVGKAKDAVSKAKEAVKKAVNKNT
jgi:uncharacterized protein YjbJ (UPF0337 family)